MIDTIPVRIPFQIMLIMLINAKWADRQTADPQEAVVDRIGGDSLSIPLAEGTESRGESDYGISWVNSVDFCSTVVKKSRVGFTHHNGDFENVLFTLTG